MEDRHPELDRLDALVGEWTLAATHPSVPDTVVRGHAAVEWLEGRRFLIHRSRMDHPDFPDSISIIGADGDEGLSLYYFDSRGVRRVYGVSMTEQAWRMWRDEEPGFRQRFEGTIGDGGDTIAGVWELSRDGSSWDRDLEIEYRRAAS